MESVFQRIIEAIEAFPDKRASNGIYVDIHPADTFTAPVQTIPAGCRVKKTSLLDLACRVYRAWAWYGCPETVDVPRELSRDEAIAYVRNKSSFAGFGEGAHCEIAIDIFSREKPDMVPYRISMCEKGAARELCVCVPLEIDQASIREYMHRQVMELQARGELSGLPISKDQDEVNVCVDYELIPGRERELCKTELVSIVPAADYAETEGA